MKIRLPEKNRLGDGLLLILVALMVWLPRGLALDRFVTPDEPKWLARSGNFYAALAHGDWAGTFTREHPGVTVTWAGTIGLLWRYPAYAWDAAQRLIHSSQIEPILRQHGHPPMEVLQAGRLVIVLWITVILAIAFWLTVRLVGRWSALIGFALIALDPFQVGLSRLLHLDALVSDLMLLSLLAFLTYLCRGRRFLALVLSGVAAGLAWLTKSPAFFLAPFLGLLLVVDWLGHISPREIPKTPQDSISSGDHRWRRSLWRAFWPLAVWAAVGWLVYFGLWPSMWVEPVNTVRRVLGEAQTYAEEGHTTETYFYGRAITGDPGKRFYPVTYLWRATPVVLIGLGLAGLWFVFQRRDAAARSSRLTAAALVLFAVIFTVFMTLGSKKFDRYLLPIYAPLDLVAGIGWAMAMGWVWRDRKSASRAVRIAGYGLGLLSILAQAAFSLPTFPYYLSYYNLLMGGSAKAPEIMMIGWGEGLDQAARYLNAKPEAASLRVMSWYPDGVFSYIFDGQTIHASPEWEQTEPDFVSSDYVVTYIHQWQRGLPFPQMLKRLSHMTPERVIVINGIEYAQIYKMP